MFFIAFANGFFQCITMLGSSPRRESMVKVVHCPHDETLNHQRYTNSKSRMYCRRTGKWFILCRRYWRKGKCHFGEDCRFIHQLPCLIPTVARSLSESPICPSAIIAMDLTPSSQGVLDLCLLYRSVTGNGWKEQHFSLSPYITDSWTVQTGGVHTENAETTQSDTG